MRQIFVFGSNEAGRHGRGAAKEAHDYWGAEYGVGSGLTGDSYAIPTKDKNLNVLPLEIIGAHIQKFIEFAKGNPKLQFIFTPVGTGLASYQVKDILSLFNPEFIPENILFTSTWFK